MPTTIEILVFTASPAFLNDISLADPALDYLKKADGCRRIVRGYAVEEDNKAYILISWSSYESCKNTIERQDYSVFQESMKALTDNPLSVLHLEFDEVADSTLDAPITEVATISPKQGHTLEEVTAVMRKMHGLTPQFPGAMYGLSIGQFIGQPIPEYILCFAGWASIEAHTRSTKMSSFQELIWEIVPIADIKMNHVEFKSH
ncbi:hypothetical protein HYPSUDRAFT_1018052 [Hypholoma sublateritium FD-334 SS-4]|uniref:ABM domain-containing protein n=1 Tax=Hypholoma sublateritium (strain FD-334 SS-4) TaxID=945553 RepID=A0A0D2PAU6_HYPSF|nr:hypothetical protein HYPSUDRAFT_1018052 [Hypholoma sublateritium FD-334 SS-4]